jgi:hypothetical protein
MKAIDKEKAITNSEKAARFEPRDMPLLYWLLFSFAFAFIYVVFLLQMDASQARSLNFRQTSETHTFLRAADNDKKPSPFGAPARNTTGRVRGGVQSNLTLASFN